MGIFNKHFLSEALTLGSQHKTKHNACALPARQLSARGTCESHPDGSSFPSLLGRECWVLQPRQSALPGLLIQLWDLFVKRDGHNASFHTSTAANTDRALFQDSGTAPHTAVLKRYIKRKDSGRRLQACKKTAQKPQSEHSCCRMLIAPS